MVRGWGLRSTKELLRIWSKLSGMDGVCEHHMSAIERGLRMLAKMFVNISFTADADNEV